MDWPEDFQFGLTLFSIGMWRSRGHHSLSMMVHNHLRKFVIIVDFSKPAKKPKKSVQLYQNIVASKPFRRSFPFTHRQEAGGVLVFEIAWDHVVGMDYRNPLCEDGRLVLEVRQVTKREFKSLNDLQMFYMPTPPPSPLPGKTGPSPFASPPKSEQDSTTVGPATPAPISVEHGEKSRGGRQPFLPSGADSPSAQNGREAASEPIASSSPQVPSAMQAPPTVNDWPRGAPEGLGRSTTLPLGTERSGSAPMLVGQTGGSSGVPTSTQNGTSKQGFPRLPALQLPGGGHSVPSVSRSMSHLEAAGSKPAEGAECSFGLRSPSGALRSGHWSVDQAGKFHLQVAAEANPWRPSGSWPAPARWTTASEVYSNRTVVLNFSNPVLPLALECVFWNNKRLLRLYESGLPSWAVFLPTYGFWYLPWMRSFTLYLYIAVSLFSLACGFYDLYKHVPFIRRMLQNLVGNMYLPIFQWLEEHTKIRLSIFLTYLFGKSPLFVSAMQLLSRALGFLRAVFGPFATAVLRPLQPAWALLEAFGLGLWETLQSLGTWGLSVLWQPAAVVLKLGRMAGGFMWSMLGLLGNLFAPLVTGIAAMVMEPLELLSQGVRLVLGLLRLGLSVGQHSVGLVGSSLASLLPAVRSGASVATHASSAIKPAVSAAEVAMHMSYWKSFILKVAYALRSIVNVITYIACTIDRHRKSLVLAVVQRWEATKTKAVERMAPRVALLQSLWQKLVFGLTVLTGLNLLRAVAVEEADAASTSADVSDTDKGSPLSVEALGKEQRRDQPAREADTKLPSDQPDSDLGAGPLPVERADLLIEPGKHGAGERSDSFNSNVGPFLDQCGAAAAVLENPSAVRRRVVRAVEPG